MLSAQRPRRDERPGRSGHDLRGDGADTLRGGARKHLERRRGNDLSRARGHGPDQSGLADDEVHGGDGDDWLYKLGGRRALRRCGNDSRSILPQPGGASPAFLSVGDGNDSIFIHPDRIGDRRRRRGRRRKSLSRGVDHSRSRTATVPLGAVGRFAFRRERLDGGSIVTSRFPTAMPATGSTSESPDRLSGFTFGSTPFSRGAAAGQRAHRRPAKRPERRRRLLLIPRGFPDTMSPTSPPNLGGFAATARSRGGLT